MKKLELGFSLAMAFFPALAPAQTGPTPPTRAAGAAAVQKEDELIAAAHTSARQDNGADVDVNLVAAPDAALQAPRSVLISRRSAAVCVWLLYERDTKRATKLARKVIHDLETMPVETDALERFDQLYWKAWLHAEVLGDTATALELIAQAEPLRPDDPRVAWSKKSWRKGS